MALFWINDDIQGRCHLYRSSDLTAIDSVQIYDSRDYADAWYKMLVVADNSDVFDSNDTVSGRGKVLDVYKLSETVEYNSVLQERIYFLAQRIHTALPHYDVIAARIPATILDMLKKEHRYHGYL